MGKESIETGPASRPEFEHLEDWMQVQMQGLIQDLLEEEVTEFLGRAKSVRRSGSDRDAGYRNGHRRPRRLTLSSGTIHRSGGRGCGTPRSDTRAACYPVRSQEPAGRRPAPQAVTARAVGGGLRPGAARSAGRGRTDIGQHGRPPEGQAERRACRVAIQVPFRPQGGLHVGRRRVREGGAGA